MRWRARLPEFAEPLQLEVLERYRPGQHLDVYAQDRRRAVQDLLLDLLAGLRLEQVQAAESSAHDYETTFWETTTRCKSRKKNSLRKKLTRVVRYRRAYPFEVLEAVARQNVVGGRIELVERIRGDFQDDR